MAGVTDAPFRSICSEFGYGLAYTEMVSAKALMYGDRKTKELLLKADEEPEPAVQIFGSDPEAIKYASDYLSRTNTPLIDINFGCPAPKIVKNGEGSALMRNLEKASSVITAAAENTDKPVTVKIRSGWNKEFVNAVEFALMAEECGASAVAVHPRTRDMYYSGKADWNMVKAVKKKVKIPVIGGGDIFTPEDVLNILKLTNCDAVMAARGAMGNPWLFGNFRNVLEGNPIFIPTMEQRVATIKNHLALMVKYKGEYRATLEIRKHAAWYLKGLYGAAELKRRMYSTKSIEEVNEVLEFFVEYGKNTHYQEKG